MYHFGRKCKDRWCTNINTQRPLKFPPDWNTVRTKSAFGFAQQRCDRVVFFLGRSLSRQRSKEGAKQLNNFTFVQILLDRRCHQKTPSPPLLPVRQRHPPRSQWEKKTSAEKRSHLWAKQPREFCGSFLTLVIRLRPRTT